MNEIISANLLISSYTYVKKNYKGKKNPSKLQVPEKRNILPKATQLIYSRMILASLPQPSYSL